MINAIIIDDEPHNINVLKMLLLKRFNTDISVIYTASSADEAFEKINRYNPQLIFLDIQMPNKTGFDLLRMFHQIPFEVIFVTSYDEYAIAAFDFNALGYILKPIDDDKLLQTVKRAIQKIGDKPQNVADFINSLNIANNSIQKISVHHFNKVLFIDIDDIIYFTAQRDSCEVRLKTEKYYASKNLKDFETILKAKPYFVRIDKSIIINTNFIKSYTKGEVCIIEMNTGEWFEVSRRKKHEINKQLGK